MIYLILFLEFFKIGLFTFGGGYAMIPLIKETVLYHAWIEESEFYDFIGLCEASPGPIAVNMASFIGFNQGGILGSVVATLGVVLPSFIIIILVASILRNVIKNKKVQAFFDGVKPVVIGLITATGLVLFAKALGYVNFEAFNINLKAVIIVLSLILFLLLHKIIFKKKMNNIIFIILASGLGILISIIL